MSEIKIELKNRKVQISLKKGKEVLDRLVFMEKGDLTEKLLPMMEKIVKRNKLQIKDIEKIKIKSDLKEPFTSYRILKTVGKIFNFFK